MDENEQIAKTGDGNGSVIKTPAEFLAMAMDMRKKFQEFDSLMSKNDSTHKSLADMWDKALEFKDTNDIVNFNLRQTQAFIGKAMNDYLDLCVRHKQQLKELYDFAINSPDKERPQNIAAHTEKERAFLKDEREHYKMVTELTHTLTQLAKEYRSCELSKQFYLHIKEFQKMLAFFKWIILSEVHDINIVRRISEQIEKGEHTMFRDIQGEILNESDDEQD